MKKPLLFFVTVLALIPCFAQQNERPESGCAGNPIPVFIWEHPAGQQVCPGKSISFTAYATMVQRRTWEMSTDGGTTWYPSIGQLTSAINGDAYYDTLTLPVVYEEMNGYMFRCTYYSGCGNRAYQTSVATLTVTGNPVQVISQPSNTVVCLGNAADFSIVITGGSLSFQWQQSINGGNSFVNMPGKNAPILHFDSVSANINNYLFRCVVNSECGGVVTSNAAILTVNNGSTTITSQPQNIFICESDTAYFTATASGSNIQYQWQRREYSTDIYSDISGANTNTLAIPQLDEINYYRCKITSNCSAVFTNEAYGYYRHAPLFYPAQIIYTCAGDMASIRPVSNNTSQNYQWMVSSDSGVTYSDIPGEISDRISILSSASNNGYRYKCFVSSPCFAGYSNATTLYSTIVPLSVVSQSQFQNACAGSQTNLYVEASGAIESYRWQISYDNGITFTDIPFSDGIHGNITWSLIGIVQVTPGSFKYRCRVIGGCTPDIYSEPITVTIFANPSIRRDTSLFVPCDTCTANIILAFDTTGFTTFTSTAVNPWAAGLGTYNLKVYNASNCSASTSINVGVKKLDTLSICAGSSAFFTSSISGSSHQWQINRGYGNGFENVSDGMQSISYDQVNGAATSTLKVEHIYSPLSVRCLVDNSIYSDTSFINIAAYWTGSVSSAWENPLNWSCGFAPNYSSDVHIFSNTPVYPVISSNNLQCRKLVIDEGATLKIKSGMNIYVHEYFIF